MMHLFILILGFMLLPEASAYQCYTCNLTDTNTNNDNCHKPFSCVLGMMMKVQCFSLKEKGAVVAKGCIPEMQCSMMKTLLPLDLSKELGVTCCDGELCNGATTSTAVSLLLLLAPVLSVAALFS